MKGLFLLTQAIVFGIFIYYFWLVEVIWPEELKEGQQALDPEDEGQQVNICVPVSHANCQSEPEGNL